MWYHVTHGKHSFAQGLFFSPFELSNIRSAEERENMDPSSHDSEKFFFILFDRCLQKGRKKKEKRSLDILLHGKNRCTQNISWRTKCMSQYACSIFFSLVINLDAELAYNVARKRSTILHNKIKRFWMRHFSCLDSKPFRPTLNAADTFTFLLVPKF